MSKIKRNDPCLCGSGKKYKKCCMNKEVEGLGSTTLFEELNNHYSHFMAYVNRNYPNFTPAERKETQEEEVEAAFRMVQNVFIEEQNNGKAIYDEFFEKKKEKITRPATLASLEAWKYPKPGIYKIKQAETAQTVSVEDIWNSERYEVNRSGIPLKEENYDHMPYLLGILLKWGPVYNFIPLAIPNYESSFQDFRSHIEQEFASSSASSLSAYLADTFINQLKTWMFTGVNKPSDRAEEAAETDEVLNHLEQNLDEEAKGNEAYEQLCANWMNYKVEKQPSFRKPEVLAAALEHTYRATTYFKNEPEKLTKKEVAAKYDVSPSTMSKRITQLKDFFEEKLV